MAYTIDEHRGLKSGSGTKYPVVWKCPYELSEIIQEFEVKDDDELAIGDLAKVVAGHLLDITDDEQEEKPVIILDTEDNKAILEGHGLTANKSSQFKDGDLLDCMLLIPGTILSVKVEASSSNLAFGDGVVTAPTDGQVKLYDYGTDDPACLLGRVLAIYTSGTGTAYILMVVGA